MSKKTNRSRSALQAVKSAQAASDKKPEETPVEGAEKTSPENPEEDPVDKVDEIPDKKSEETVEEVKEREFKINCLGISLDGNRIGEYGEVFKYSDFLWDAPDKLLKSGYIIEIKK